MCVCVDETHSASSRIQQELLTVLLIQKALVKLSCMCLGKVGRKMKIYPASRPQL